MGIQLNWIAIIVISIVSFFFGAAWHGEYFFGKIWLRIHYGKDKFTEEEMKKAMDGMWVIMITEFIATFFMVMTLDFLMRLLPGYTPWHVAFLVWIGFVLPTMTSIVIWWADTRKWMLVKILISGSFRLITLVASAYVLNIW